jgi:glycosyltransferase involved in cell wall biosynthesis
MVSDSPVPTALLLVGDYVAGINELPQPRWRKEAIRLWSYWNKWGQNRAVRRSLTFVNSRVLYRELQGKTLHLHEVRTTTLTREDFFERTDTCQTRPIRLLYVGRMDRAKGLLQMVQAVASLRERGEEVVLELVGWAERGDPVLQEIEALSHQNGIANSVHYAGSRPLGPELFAFYRQADIFLIASLASEGFPRTIWEAMAHSLPVVATRVGSIPLLIEGAASLILPGSAEAIAEAVEQLIHTPALRQEQIKAGFARVQEITLENQTGELVEKMNHWLGEHGHG